MTVYSQNDPAWKDNKIGFDQGPYDTIGNYGCYMTAIANVCSWAGNDVNPQQINDICKDRGWLVSSDLVSRDDVPSQLCSNLQFQGRTNWYTETPMGFFADASDPNIAYIICIDASKAPGIQTHFVMVWATNGPNDLIIDDSWDGQRKSLTHYGTPSVVIQSATKFRKIAVPEPAPAPPPIVVVVPEPTPPPTPYVPPAAPVKGTLATKYKVQMTIMQFANSQDAIFHNNPTTIASPGEYYQFDSRDSTVQLGKDNMTAQFWINTKDNVAPVAEVSTSPDPAVNPTESTGDWRSTFTSFPNGKSRRYIAQRDLTLYDLAGTTAKELNISAGTPVPIYGSVQKGKLTYLVPRLVEDTVEGQVAPKVRWYGIPTTSVYTGLPGMKSQTYIDDFKRAEEENRITQEENRIYRKSVHHETTSDKVYYAEQLVARFVKDGGRFVDGIISGATIKKITAVLKGGQKDKK